MPLTTPEEDKEGRQEVAVAAAAVLSDMEPTVTASEFLTRVVQNLWIISSQYKCCVNALCSVSVSEAAGVRCCLYHMITW